jgi:outer membrane protein OmpA-like peptidoglycan-associated protein
MRSSFDVFVVALMAVFLPAAASADPTPQDYVKELQAQAPPAASTAPPAACENGESRDESGACPVVDESEATRGFTLFSGSMAKPQGPARPTPAPAVASATRAGQAQSQGQTPPRCGLLCDLKVNFRSGSAELTPDSEGKLMTFADALRDPSLARRRFEIAGHTDASGSPERNQALSQARAEAVRRFLVAHGVQPARLEARGYGSEGLVLPNAPLDPRNRRVEARVLN